MPSPALADVGAPVPPAEDEPADAPRRMPGGPVQWFLTWLPVAIIPLMGLLLFNRLNRPITDPDTFWHLRLGSYLWQTWRFAGPEQWSSLAQRPLVLHEWSPELLYVLVHNTFGWAGLSYLQAFGAVVLLASLYVCSRQFSPPLVASLAAITAWAGASGSVMLRPQVVTFVLLAVFTTAWLKTYDDGVPRWWLVPLTWLWACSHGMWFVGVGLGAVIVLGMALDRRLSVRSGLRLAAIPIGGALISALTPVGPRLLASPGGMRDYTTFVSEWQTPSPFMFQALVSLVMAAALVILWSKAGISPSWTDLILLGVGVAFTLTYARTIALGAIILGLLLARTAARFLPVRSTRVRGKRHEVAVVGVGLAIVCLVGPWTAQGDVSRPAEVPSAFDSSLARLPAGTVVFNDYQLGGWMLWEHPALDPVIDGRADVYSVKHFRSVIEAYDLVPGWRNTLARSGASAAVLKQESGLTEALVNEKGWTKVGEDKGYVLLLGPQR